MKFTFARCLAALKRRPAGSWLRRSQGRSLPSLPAAPKDLLQRLREAGL